MHVCKYAENWYESNTCDDSSHHDGLIHKDRKEDAAKRKEEQKNKIDDMPVHGMSRI